MIKILEIVERTIKSWLEWQKAKTWAKLVHSSWVYLATQQKRPEIRRTYRKKILEAYKIYNKIK